MRHYIKPINFTIESEVLELILPFYVLLNSNAVVTSVGPSLAKISKSDQLIGQYVFDALRIIKPRQLKSELKFRDALGVRLKIEIEVASGSGRLGLFGTAFPIDYAGTPYILIALTPGVNAKPCVEIYGLKFSDFGPADGSADILPLLAMQQDMLEDGKKRTAKLRAARDLAEYHANHDVLTELPNRRSILKYLNEQLLCESIGIIHIDLDRFKEINDLHGHAAGDAALRHTATAMKQVLSDSVTCARLGGDEFLALVKGLTSREELMDLANQLIGRISQSFSYEGKLLSISASAGVAVTYPTDESRSTDILHRADLALYEIKRAGGNKSLFCTPAIMKMHSDFQILSADIERGLAKHEFVAYMQPQIHAKTLDVVGFEALARWEHSNRGLLLPAHFLQTTDRAGLMQSLDQCIRHSALDSMQSWDRSGKNVPKISLNVTVSDLICPKFREILISELEVRNLDSSRIVLEIVESVLYDESAAQITQACQALVNEGFLLALDDFGTGYASILSLVNLPISIVKIDRAFIAGVSKDKRKQALILPMITMATNLGLEVLAEGVDDEADGEMLSEMGCKIFQSYHFGRPMAPEYVLAWLEKRS